MSPQQQSELEEPLLGPTEQTEGVESQRVLLTSTETDNDVESPCPETDDEVVGEGGQPTIPDSSTSTFSVKTEMWEMISLGFPLAVSFFCRMGMASTDSAFVGHIRNGEFTPETYLAAAVLSDMCVSIFTTPPLAFNQVLNSLVGQAVGSGNPKMAGIWLQQSCFWLSISMLPCLVGFFYVEPVLKRLGFPTDVCEVAGTYAMYNIVWPIPNGLYQCMRFYFQAQGRPNPAMFNNIIFLFVNGFLNWIFVFGGPFRYLWGWKGLGFIGAAISLSISRTMQGVTYFLYMFVYKKHHLTSWPDGGLSFSHHTIERTKEFMKQSLPNLGTLLFSVISGQAITVLVGRLGERAIAASAALSTVTTPWNGTLSATTWTISGVRVGYHLGRGDGMAAKKSAWMVLHFLSIVMVIVTIIYLPFQHAILSIATDDQDVLSLSIKLIPAMLVANWLNLLVGNITSGVFSGMGRPIIATLLSFGFELPMSIGGVAIYILLFHGNLIGVYWWNAIACAIEVVVVLALLFASDWNYWAGEAQRRQEARPTDTTTTTTMNTNEDDEDEGQGDEETAPLVVQETSVPDDEEPVDDESPSTSA